MKFLFFDFETFYTKDYSLRKMTTPEYIFHPQWETISCGVQIDDGPVDVVPGPDFGRWISALDPNEYTTVAYNALFDNAILAWRYNWVPRRMVDALGLARYSLSHILPRLSLEKVSEHFGLPAKGNIMHLGLSYQDLVSRGLWSPHVDYTKGDVANCHTIFDRLAPGFPAGEWKVMDLVLRAAVQPQFQPNIEMLRAHHAKLVADKENLIERSGLTREQLSSAAEFAAALELYGVTVEHKETDKGNWIPAVAKTDNFMKELAEHDDEWVRTAAEARLGVKSTLEESRCARLLAIAELPWSSVASCPSPAMPIPLRYAGSHTQRLSGEWKINMQNLPKAKPDRPAILRKSLEAPAGHTVVVADLGQIEARLTAWLSHSPLIDAFRQGTDVYRAMAAEIFATPMEKVTDQQRFVGKSAVLGLGFGLGATNFYRKTVVNARLQGEDITSFFTPELAQQTVDVYRRVNKPTVQLWYLLDELLRSSWMGRKTPQRVGPVVISHGTVTGPGSLQMRYDVPYGPRDNPEEIVKYPAPREDIFYRHGGRPHKIYGAAFLENIIQFLARIIFFNAAVRIAKQGYPMANTSHDEAGWVVLEKDVDAVKELVHRELTTPPSWAPDLPLKASVESGKSYGDAK